MECIIYMTPEIDSRHHDLILGKKIDANTSSDFSIHFGFVFQTTH